MQMNFLTDIHTSVSERDRSSEYGSDSHNVDITPTKRQKTLVIDSDKESEYETHTAGKRSFDPIGECIEETISLELEDFTGVHSHLFPS